MPLMPKRTKHRKVQKGRMRGKATRGNKVTDGEFGIQAVTGALITGYQIEVEYWVAAVKPGRVMFEIAGVPEETAREALRLAMNKLPNKTKFVAKETEKVGENDEDK